MIPRRQGSPRDNFPDPLASGSDITVCQIVHTLPKVRPAKYNQLRLALWKKVEIGGVCLLVVSVLVVGSVLYFRSKRGAVLLYDGIGGSTKGHEIAGGIVAGRQQQEQLQYPSHSVEMPQ
ncbi:platelet endothelial cell adhesion molecule-like isoform X5 [Lates japonicus]|uniref:Platelet endothelial cell adhesion molecule-like isoform X5 n=1 Tax=Lates japonicus TaxID=270547 RepID=A0AAD3MXN8_LATJO|nr:platelet endothelial cell adhesion molecule-like isoform X5 [Lates japonicus]